MGAKKLQEKIDYLENALLIMGVCICIEACAIAVLAIALVR